MHEEHPIFIQLIQRMLTYDPSYRIILTEIVELLNKIDIRTHSNSAILILLLDVVEPESELSEYSIVDDNI